MLQINESFFMFDNRICDIFKSRNKICLLIVWFAIIIAAWAFIVMRPLQKCIVYSTTYSITARAETKFVCALITLAQTLIVMSPSELIAFWAAYKTARAQTKLDCALIIAARALIAISPCKMHCLFYISIVCLRSS